MQGFVLQEVSELAHKAVQSSQLLNRLEDQRPKTKDTAVTVAITRRG